VPEPETSPEERRSSALDALYRHVDRAIARSIDSRFPNLVHDLTEAVAEAMAAKTTERNDAA
jgi:hypothetical protein